MVSEETLYPHSRKEFSKFPYFPIIVENCSTMAMNEEFPSLDEIDRAILRLLQDDSTLSIQQVADQVGLTTTPCWRRIQKLEDTGVIRRRVALLDPHKLNVGVTVFVSIRTNQHSQEWFDHFAAVVEAIPEVVGFYRMSGDIDYLLRVVVPDIAAYDEVYKTLIERVDLLDVSSSFAMEQLKFTTALPLRYIRA